MQLELMDEVFGPRTGEVAVMLTKSNLRPTKGHRMFPFDHARGI